MKKLTTLFMAVLLLQSLSIFAQDAAPLPEENPLATEPAATIVDGEEEDEEKGFELTGFVDAYYQAGLTESSEAEEPIAFPTSFTDQTNQFAIGMVNLMATKEMGKVSFVGQVGFGPRAVAANSDSNDDGSFGDNFASTIQQLYVSYSPSDAVTFTLGNFGTFVGYEVIDAPANVNYSTSYLFSNGPFYHTGAKVDFAISDGFGKMVRY
ncbi:MAG: outer membrane beta-barrel protein [Bacteroidota bacterium]